MAFVYSAGYIGDWAAGDVVVFGFTSTDAAGFPTDFDSTPSLVVHKARTGLDETTGITISTTLTTGALEIRITTSGNAFYDDGEDYIVYIETGAVDGDTVVGYVIASFSIAHRTGGSGSAPTVEEIVAGIVAVSLTGSQMADYVLNRNSANARASADGDARNYRSLLGAISRLANRAGVSGSDFVTYEEDDTTAFGTQPITTDAAADPISELDGGS